jgi:hypothetical protein
MLTTVCGAYAGTETTADLLPYKHEKTRIVFPAQLGLFKKFGQVIYSPEKLGIGVRYMYQVLELTYMCMILRQKNIHDGNSNILQQHFTQNLRDNGDIALRGILS